jgi:hypothetical protein
MYTAGILCVGIGIGIFLTLIVSLLMKSNLMTPDFEMNEANEKYQREYGGDKPRGF